MMLLGWRENSRCTRIENKHDEGKFKEGKKKKKENGIIIWYILVRKRLNHFHGSWTRTKAMFCIQGCIPSNEAPHSLCTLLLPSFHPCLARFGCAYAFPCSFPSIYRSSSSGAITSPNFRLSFKFSDPNRRCSKSVHFMLVNLLVFPGPVSNYHKKYRRTSGFSHFFFSLTGLDLNLAEKRIDIYLDIYFYREIDRE